MSDHVETTNPCLIFTATIPGEVPALARIVVDEDQGKDQLTAIVAARVRNYDPDPPAAMYFEADTLTPVGAGATRVTTSLPTGTSGSATIAASALTTTWQDILKSTVVSSALTSVTGVTSTDVFTKTSHGMVNGASVVLSAKTGGTGLSTSVTYYVINRAANTFQLALTPGGAAVDLGTDVSSLTVTPTTYWTHTGRYRVLARVFPSTTSTGTVQVRASWGLGDLAIYSQGPARSVQVGTWTLADLGVINIPASASRWEFRLQAKSSVNADGIYADVIYLPCADEVSGTAQVVTEAATVTQTVYDTFNQSSGNLNGKTPSPQADGNWAESSAGKFTIDTGTHQAVRSGVSDTVGSNNGAFAIASSSALAGQFAQVQLQYSVAPADGAALGVVLRYTNTSNWVAAVLATPLATGVGVLTILKCVAGSMYTISSSTTPDGFPYPPVSMSAGQANIVQGGVYANGTMYARAYANGIATAPITLFDADLAAGSGTLDTGKFGIIDHYTSGTACTRQYDSFIAGSFLNNAACFASQSIEFSDEGWRREDSAGVVWGDPGDRQGDNFLIPPGTAEVFVKMSRARIGYGGDNGVDDVSARLYVTERGLLLPS